MASLLIDVLRHIGSGETMRLVPVSQMLTTQQATGFLNELHPDLISLIDGAAVPHMKVGRHRCVETEDLFAYRRKRDGTRDKALPELAENQAELI